MSNICHRLKSAQEFQRDLYEEGYTLFRNTTNVVDWSVVGIANVGEVEVNKLAGQLHAERMLNHQQHIPEQWREFRLLFPRTVWFKDGEYWIAYLYFMDGEWDLDFCQPDKKNGSGNERVVYIAAIA